MQHPSQEASLMAPCHPGVLGQPLADPRASLRLPFQDAGDRWCRISAPGLVRLGERLLLLWFAHVALGLLHLQVPADGER